MIILVGTFIVFASVLGGFMMGGGHFGALIQVSEFVVICGSAVGAMIIMSPKKVLIDMVKQIAAAFKGSPYSRANYEELFKSLYELFLLGRRNGMIAREEHVQNPQTSAIFTKYPSFVHNERAVRLLCDGLRPIIDGKVKPDQLRLLLETEIETMEDEHHKPVNVLTRVGDSMPGFGIVAAVLGIVITMGSISGPIEQIGHHVAAALVGTFLGILISYGFVNPLAVNLEFNGMSELGYFRCIATAVTGFAGGMAPVMAIEMARRGLSEEVRPTADELESLVKGNSSGESKS
jgi:chemotaxis protein MotA